MKNRGYTYRSTARCDSGPEDVLGYHAARYPHLSRAEWCKAIEAGQVYVNARVVDLSCRVESGDCLEFRRPPWEEPPAPLRFEVAYEDADVLVVVKPAGLQVLPAGAFTEKTLLCLVRGSTAERSNASPIHRLGRGTAGLVLFGKTALARAILSRQFRDFSAQKTYLACVQSAQLPLSLDARHPIGTREHGPLRIACVDPLGKDARTRVRVLRRDYSSDTSIVAAQPITGRSDQIRIHLAALGAPLVGEPLYGIGGQPIADKVPGEGGYLLHAAGLRILHPRRPLVLRLRSYPAWLGPTG